MMSTKKYRIRLTTDEQQELNALVSRGRAAAYKQTHARILLMSDESRSDGGMKDADITSALGVGQSTVERIRKRCVEEGVESALNRKKQLRRRQKRLDGEGEARLIAMACGEPPEGRASWTLKLLADQLVECEIVGTISTETVRQGLKKNELKPWLKQSWCIPPGQSAEFVCAMEDVLEVYQRPYDGNEVLVCMDETSKQQVKETRVPQIPHLDKRKTSLDDAMRAKMFCCTDKPSPTRCTYYEARLTGVPVRRGEEYDGYDSIVGADDVRRVDARSGFEVVGGAPRGSAGRWSGLDGQPDNHVADTAEPGRR